MKLKELFKNGLVPRVDIQGDRFTITPPREQGDVIDAEIVDEKAMVPLRPEASPTNQSAPKVGHIPKHSWGC